MRVLPIQQCLQVDLKLQNYYARDMASNLVSYVTTPVVRQIKSFGRCMQDMTGTCNCHSRKKIATTVTTFTTTCVKMSRVGSAKAAEAEAAVEAAVKTQSCKSSLIILKHLREVERGESPEQPHQSSARESYSSNSHKTNNIRNTQTFRNARNVAAHPSVESLLFSYCPNVTPSVFLCPSLLFITPPCSLSLLLTPSRLLLLLLAPSLQTLLNRMKVRPGFWQISLCPTSNSPTHRVFDQLTPGKEYKRLTLAEVIAAAAIAENGDTERMLASLRRHQNRYPSRYDGGGGSDTRLNNDDLIESLIIHFNSRVFKWALRRKLISMSQRIADIAANFQCWSALTYLADNHDTFCSRYAVHKLDTAANGHIPIVKRILERYKSGNIHTPIIRMDGMFASRTYVEISLPQLTQRASYTKTTKRSFTWRG